MRTRECDTYTVWSPTNQTITARCSCGWAAPTRPQTQIVEATNDEIEHLWAFLAANARNPPETDT